MWSRNFFIQKANQEKNLFIKKLGILIGWHASKNRPEKTDSAAPQKIQKPRFYSYVPFDDSVFFNKNNKEIPTKKKNSFFQFCLFLKKREKNLKEKNPSELLYKALMTTFLITLTINMRWHFLNVFNLIY